MTAAALRPARLLTWTGLVLTVAVAALPFVAPVLLADQVRAGYPDYTATQVQEAVLTWQSVLALLAGLGALGWVWTLWSLRRPRRWAPFSATALLAVALVLAVALLSTPDTSGQVGLAPAVGWAWLVPCMAGVAVTIASWRSRTAARADLA